MAAVVLGVVVSGCAVSGGGAKVVPYPLDTCLVTGNDLESMGGSVREVYEGRELKFCCRPCVRKFHRAPQKYLERLERARVGG